MRKLLQNEVSLTEMPNHHQANTPTASTNKQVYLNPEARPQLKALFIA
jgi:hypothetical protein